MRNMNEVCPNIAEFLTMMKKNKFEDFYIILNKNITQIFTTGIEPQFIQVTSIASH